MAQVISGAEDYRSEGGPIGVLVLHGFTGNPSSMRPLAEALSSAGHAVELPRLPGHGTTIDDMMTTTWLDWSGAAESSLIALSGRSTRQFVVGLSMGGSIACWLASRHPELLGIICINPAITAQKELRDLVRQLLEAGETVMDGVGSDIAEPGAVESAYTQTPIAPLLSLFDAAEAFGEDLSRITQPMLLMNSPQDHVVPPSDSDELAAAVGGPVERVILERSYHVATRDYDKDIIIERSLDFVARHSD